VINYQQILFQENRHKTSINQFTASIPLPAFLPRTTRYFQTDGEGKGLSNTVQVFHYNFEEIFFL